MKPAQRMPTSHIVALVLCTGCSLLLALLYFAAFAPCVEAHCDPYVLPYNVPDHLIYAGIIENLDSMPLWFPIVSNYGVSLIYYYLLMPVGGVSLDGLATLSLALNLTLYVGAVASFVQLARAFAIDERWTLPFIFYPPLLFFSALINKDIFLVFLILRLALAFVHRRTLSIAVITLLLGLIRFQYALVPLLIGLLSTGRFKYRFCIAYAATSLATALVTRSTELFSFEQDQSGLTDLIFGLNRDFLIGSLLFNPLRVVQYPLGLAKGWFLAFTDEGIDLMKVTEAATFLWFVHVIPGALRFLYHSFAAPEPRKARVLRAGIVAYLLALLLTAITEPRYLMPLYPLLLLASRWPRIPLRSTHPVASRQSPTIRSRTRLARR